MLRLLKMIIIDGFMVGGIYAILAVGFSLVFGVARILNMAHTAFYMIAAYLLFLSFKWLGSYSLIAIISVIFITAVLGIICYALFLDRVKEHEIPVMIISIALAMLFQEILLFIFGEYFRGVPTFFHGYTEIYQIRVSYQRLFTIAITGITLIGLWIVLSKSRLGIAIKSVSQGREIAGLMGIDVSRVCMITMGIALILAGISAALSAPLTPVSPFMWMPALIIVLAAVVLGGVGSLKGSIIGAFILGFAETIIVVLFPGAGYLKGVVSFSVMIVVLLFKPEGLFGVIFEEERL